MATSPTVTALAPRAVLLETFCESLAGTCCAVNWIPVGKMQGRGKAKKCAAGR